jgi:DNA-binding transcriptional LysR family regulator
MAYSARNLPPAKSLVAFEAAARNLSFTAAAKELNVTRVAVSRQVKSLESFIGVQLFQRGHSEVKLTPAGKRLYRVVNRSLQGISDAVEDLSDAADNNLITISTTLGVSTYWLMPIIGRYRSIDPAADFRVLSSSEYVNLASEQVDVAIRYGDGNWTGVESRLLARQQIVPTCSRAYLSGRGTIAAIGDLLNENLLQFETAVDPSSFWPNWFRDAGVAYAEGHRQSIYESFINFVQALLDGQGIALVGPPLMTRFYESGVLVKAVEAPIVTQQGYYLCWPEGFARRRSVVDFADWLAGEMRAGPAEDADIPLGSA